MTKTHHHDDPLLDVADETSFQHGGAAPGLCAQIKNVIHEVEERLHKEEEHAEPFSWSHQLEG